MKETRKETITYEPGTGRVVERVTVIESDGEPRKKLTLTDIAFVIMAAAVIVLACIRWF